MALHAISVIHVGVVVRALEKTRTVSEGINVSGSNPTRR